MLGAFGEVQVVDWGFAKVLGLQRSDDEERLPTPDPSVISTVRTGEGSSQSIAGSVMGTPAYMPPEQAMGLIDRLDERSDVFSLGAILCEILTGQPPYVGEQVDLLILAAQAKLDDAHARLDACGAHAELVSLAKRCLQPLRGDRPANASEVADGVSAHLAGVEERAKRAEIEAADERGKQREEQARLEREAATLQWERQARRRVVVLAALLLLAVLLGGGGYWFVQGDREEQARRTMVAVREAEDEARLFEGRSRWDEAIAAAERGVRLAAQPEIDAETRARTRSMRSRLESKRRAVAAAQAQRERNAVLVDRLAEIQAQGLRGHTRAQVMKEYGYAFAEHDLDLEQPDFSERAQIVRALITALDDFELLTPDKETVRARLLLADPDPWRTRVRKLHYAGDGDGLAKMVAEELGEQPAASVALLGHVLLAQGRPDLAERVLADAYHRFPADYRIVVLLADAFLAQQQPEPASRFLTGALALRSTSMALRNRLGLALAHAGDLDAAVTTLQEGKLAGLDMEGYCQLGHVLARRGDREAAVDAFREAMRQQPKSARPHHQLGLALVQSFQDYEGAIAAYKDALRREPQSAEVHRALGLAYDGNGDSERALASIDHALDLDPEFVAGHESRGIVLFGRQRFVEAIGEFMRVTKEAPHRASGWYWLARVYLETGRYPGANANLAEAYRLGYRGRDLFLLRGRGYAGIGRTQDALQWLKRAVQEHKKYADAMCHLGRVTFRSGDWKQGLELSRRGHELGKALGGRWHYPSEEQVARQARQFAIVERLAAGATVPPSADLAAVHFHAKRYEEAARVYAALDELPAGEARLHAAAAALRAGAADRARAWMEAELAYWRPRVLRGDALAYRTMMDWREGWLLEPADAKEWEEFFAAVTAALAEGGR
ncbi:MAG: tetratricopeptide repeat protein [Planctomycetota bacterium]|jgi:tetratricopeptide (TPR) repeat protein